MNEDLYRCEPFISMVNALERFETTMNAEKVAEEEEKESLARGRNMARAFENCVKAQLAHKAASVKLEAARAAWQNFLINQ